MIEATSPPPPEPWASRLAVRLHRRGFLTATLSAALAAALGGCTEDKRVPTTPGPSATVVAGAPSPTPSAELQRFLTLSALLTGVQQLDAGAAQRYLAALQTPPPEGMTLQQLYQATGIGSSAPPASFAALAATSVLNQPAAKTTAQAIATCWYTGQVPGSGDGTVVTYRDTLGWKALTFATAPGQCGGAFGFWSAVPPA
jgi:hypothetical protein